MKEMLEVSKVKKTRKKERPENKKVLV